MSHATLASRTTGQGEPSFTVAPMTLDDIPAVMHIERASFPMPWPQQAYEYELQKNPSACFIVARAPAPAARPETALTRRLWQYLFRPKPDPANRPVQPVVGFAGMWLFVDEAHISTIASHPEWRGRGVGELLLLSEMREAQRRDAAFVTLEVRVSNAVAQNLYRKYAFEEVGRRKRYYRDNGEDALIMTVVRFKQPGFQAELDDLEGRLRQRLGDWCRPA